MNAGSLGGPALVVALLFAIGGVALSAFSAQRGRPVFGEIGRRALAVATAFVVFAVVVLFEAFITHDFSLAYVAN